MRQRAHLVLSAYPLSVEKEVCRWAQYMAMAVALALDTFLVYHQPHTLPYNQLRSANYTCLDLLTSRAIFHLHPPHPHIIPPLLPFIPHQPLQPARTDDLFQLGPREHARFRVELGLGGGAGDVGRKGVGVGAGVPIIGQVANLGHDAQPRMEVRGRKQLR